MKKSYAILLILILPTIGCVAPVIHNTPSGRPEVTVANTTAKQVGAYLTNKMLNSGYSLTKQTDFIFAFDRPVNNPMASAFLGSQYDSTPNARVIYTVAESGESVRVVADLEIVTNPGSAFERLTDFNANQDSLMIQALLDSMKADLESSRRSAGP